MGTPLLQSLVRFDPRGVYAGLLYEGWRKENLLLFFFPLNEVVGKYEVWRSRAHFSAMKVSKLILLQKPVIEKPSTTLRELENLGLLHRQAQSSEPQTKGLQSFYKPTVVGNTTANRLV